MLSSDLSPAFVMSPAVEFVTLRAFRYQGTDYENGDWVSKDVVDSRMILMLSDQKMIEPRPADTVEKVGPAQRPERPTPAAAVTDPEDDAEKDLPLKVRHGGFGKWYVEDEARTRLAGPFREKSDAKASRDALLAISG